jgi:hypothetical protein
MTGGSSKRETANTCSPASSDTRSTGWEHRRASSAFGPQSSVGSYCRGCGRPSAVAATGRPGRSRSGPREVRLRATLVVPLRFGGGFAHRNGVYLWPVSCRWSSRNDHVLNHRARLHRLLRGRREVAPIASPAYPCRGYRVRGHLRWSNHRSSRCRHRRVTETARPVPPVHDGHRWFSLRSGVARRGDQGLPESLR